MKKKILALLLTLCLLSSAIIPAALAVDGSTAGLSFSGACSECGSLTGHLDSCSQYEDPADAVDTACPGDDTCTIEGCPNHVMATADDVDTTDGATVDNCPYCEDTTADDGTVTHAEGCNAAYTYDGATDVGKYVKLNDYYADSAVFVHDGSNDLNLDDVLVYDYIEFEEGLIFQIADWYWDSETTALWYKVTVYEGSLPDDDIMPAEPWILQNYTDNGDEDTLVPAGVELPGEEENVPVSLSKTVDGITVTVAGILPGVVDINLASVGTGSIDLEYVGIESLAQILAAVDITPVDADGNTVQPEEGASVSVAICFDGLAEHNGQQIEIRHDHNGAVRSLGYVTVAEGAVSFETDGFSTYYLVAGSQSDSSGNDTFYILRGVSVELTNVTSDNYSVTCPDNKSSAECGVTISRSGNTLTFAAGNSALYGTYTVKISSSRTTTITIMSARDMFELDNDTVKQDVYFTVISDSTEVPKEPMAGGSYTWNYIKKSGSSYTFSSSAWGSNGRYATSTEGFLNLDAIASSPKLTQNLQGQNVIGVIDSVDSSTDIPGADTWTCVELTDEEWHTILKAFVSSKTVTISDGKGGSVTLTSAMVDEKLPDGSYRYRMFPYVVKLIINGGSAQDGWHVDCAVIDYSNHSVTYDYNLPEAVVIDESGDLVVPDTAFYLHGTDDVEVAYMKLVTKNSWGSVTGSSKVTDSTGITIYDPADMSTSEYYFVEWNTKPDGTGDSYSPANTLPPITENVTLYAIWRTNKTTGTVRVNKVVAFEDEGDPRKNESITYTFTVTFAGSEDGDAYPYTVYNADGTIKTGNVSISSGDEVTLIGGEYALINNVPAGNVAVAEVVGQNAGYEPAWAVGSGSAVAGTQTTGTLAAGERLVFTCTNTYPAEPTGNLQVTKLVTGENIPEGDKFSFIVNLPNGSYGYTLTKADGSSADGTLTSMAGSAPFVLEKDETIKIKDIPVDSYTVTEEDHPDYITDPDPAKTAVVEENGTAELTFTNTYPRPKSKLSISKTVTGEDAPANDEFGFAVNLPSGSYSYTLGGTGGTLTSVNNSASFTLKHGQTITISDVPVGSYTVTEEAKDHYTPDHASKSVTVVENSTAQVSFTNTYSKPVGNITITKRLGDTGADVPQNQIFTFTVAGSNVTLENGDVYSGYTVSGNKLTVTVTGAGSVTVEGLPVGTYIVSENTYGDYDQYVGSAAATSGVVGVQKDGTATIVFTNTYKRADLTVSKTVDKAYAEDSLPNESFSFSFGINTSSSYDYVITKANGGTQKGEVSDGDVFQLAAGDEIVIKDIPVKSGYSVTEIADADYTTKVDGKAGLTAQGMMDVDGASHVFANTYRRHLGSLTINKVVEGEGASSTDSFVFTVTGPTGFKTTQVIIIGGGSVTLKDVPVGTYTVTEETWSWRYTSSGVGSATISLDDLTAEVTITNTYSNDNWLGSETSAANEFDAN